MVVPPVEDVVEAVVVVAVEDAKIEEIGITAVEATRTSSIKEIMAFMAINITNHIIQMLEETNHYSFLLPALSVVEALIRAFSLQVPVDMRSSNHRKGLQMGEVTI